MPPPGGGVLALIALLAASSRRPMPIAERLLLVCVFSYIVGSRSSGLLALSLSLSSVPNKAVWKQGMLAAPGLGASLLPKVICPFCWPSYAALLSGLGLGFLISTAYLLALTAVLLSGAVGSLAYQASRRRGLGPFWVGLVGMILVLTGKFHFGFEVITFGGAGLLAIASIWNVWPRRAGNALCPACNPTRSFPSPEDRVGEVLSWDTK